MKERKTMVGHISEQKLAVLYQISQVIGQALDLDSIMNRMLSILSETLTFKRGTITLVDESTGHLVIRASHGLTSEERRRGVYRLGEGVTGRIFRSAEPFVVPDISLDPLFMNKTGARDIEKDRISFLGVPILLQGEPIGVLSADRLFGDEISYLEDIQFLSILAMLIAQLVSLNRQVEAREGNLIRQNQSLKAEIRDLYQNFFIVGGSGVMKEVQRVIERVAPARATVLLLGESGTGKTLAARILHELSPRARLPFVKINCAAVPENLLESEFFGHEKGAFTGATSSKPGRFEEADGGTVFLDEIGEIPLGLQAKLLRFLQERDFERVGGNRTIHVDVRIVAATNRNLADAVRQGLFREDLFYRLNVVPIRIPALRERRGDIMALVRHFTDRLAREYGRTLEFDAEAMDALEAYDWPGNVREIENLLERLAIISDADRIGADELAPYLAGSVVAEEAYEGGLSEGSVGNSIPPASLQDVERREVLAALEKNDWNQASAARDLGITPRQIGYKIKKFGLLETVAHGRDAQMKKKTN